MRGIWLGRRRYEPVHELQGRLHAARQRGLLSDTVLFVEHEPVVTLGRGARPEHLLVTPEALAERGIDLSRTGRGGDVTLHAPGQLVAYPIIDLSPDRRDVRRFVGDLTETMRRLASELGIETGRHEKHVGLWANRASPGEFPGAAPSQELVKVGAIGVRISRWVTMHGFALNLFPDLELYRLIVPCGIREHGVASIASLGGTLTGVEVAARRAFELFASVIGREPERFDDRRDTVLELLVPREVSNAPVASTRVDEAARLDDAGRAGY